MSASIELLTWYHALSTCGSWRYSIGVEIFQAKFVRCEKVVILWCTCYICNTKALIKLMKKFSTNSREMIKNKIKSFLIILTDFLLVDFVTKWRKAYLLCDVKPVLLCCCCFLIMMMERVFWDKIFFITQSQKLNHH